MLIREGTIDYIKVTAEGNTILELDDAVESMNHKYPGKIIWGEDIYEKNIVASRSEVFDVSVLISRNHSIKVQRDSTLPGPEKWIAAYNNYSAYGTSKDEAVNRVVDLIKQGPNDYV